MQLMDAPRANRFASSHIKVSVYIHVLVEWDIIDDIIIFSQSSADRNKNAWPERQDKQNRQNDRNAIPMGSNTSGGVKLLGASGLTSADRHGGSVQVVSSTNGDLTTDDPATGHSNTPITGPVELDAVSETK